MSTRMKTSGKFFRAKIWSKQLDEALPGHRVEQRSFAVHKGRIVFSGMTGRRCTDQFLILFLVKYDRRPGTSQPAIVGHRLCLMC